MVGCKKEVKGKQKRILSGHLDFNHLCSLSCLSLVLSLIPVIGFVSLSLAWHFSVSLSWPSSAFVHVFL
jgi:hypothetical protein